MEAPRASVLLALALCLTLVLLALAASAWAARDDLTLVSRAAGAAGAKGNGASSTPSVSADGRLVAFESNASNLHSDDPDTTFDVFVRDVLVGTTTLVSRAAGVPGAKGDGASVAPSISADGRFVAFRSSALNLHPDDADPTLDVFVRDLQAGTTTLVSRAPGAAGAKGDGASSEPSISADGRFVAFRSSAANLNFDDTDIILDVFVRDVQANTTTLVSRAPGAAGAKGNGTSAMPSISADGRFVAFASNASNLHPDDADATLDVFVRDLQANTTTLVSRSGAVGAKGNSGSREPSISADGRSVVFQSTASNLHSDDGDGTSDVFVRDLQANTTTLVSRSAGTAGAKGNGFSDEASISADGRSLAFRSAAGNLHPDDGDLTIDVFVRDLQANTTTLVSRSAGAAGAKGNDSSTAPSISADGRFAVFPSSASNLHPDDADATLDVFVRDVLGPPPDLAPTPTLTPALAPTPTPAPTPAPAPVIDATAPLLSRLTLTPTRFRVDSAPTPRSAATRGTRVSYRLSEAARADFAVERARPGRLKRVRGTRRCVKPTRNLVRAKAGRCTRYGRVGQLTRNGAVGTNGFRFSGRIGTKPLRPGRYRMRATATDPANNSSRRSTREFWIVRR